VDPRDIVALIMIAACVLIFGFFGIFFPDWIGISPRKKKGEEEDETDTSDQT